MKAKRMRMLLCFVVFGVMAVMAKELKTATFSVPQMHCQNCEKKVKENIRFEKGVKEIAVNLENKTVTITYDADKTNVDNLIKGFKKIKYDVTLSTGTDAAGDSVKSSCKVGKECGKDK